MRMDGGKTIWEFPYVCANCGYSEEWIRQEDIPTLKDKKGVMLEE